MKFIGAHVSIKGGIDKAVLYANKIKATAFSLFTKNQLQWKPPILKEEIIKKFKKNCKKYGYGEKQIIAHGSYLINLGNPNKNLLKKSRTLLLEEANRCEKLGICLLNFHPGSYMNKINISQCLLTISESINLILNKTNSIKLVIENTAGQGYNVGFKFEHLKEIIEKIENKKRIGVCIDTCHAFASGYDLRTIKNCNNTFQEFEKIVGFKYLKCMHLNDSKKSLKSYVDRHENLGKGKIGYTLFDYIMKDNRFNNIPLILETINSDIWEKEITWLKSKQNN